MEIIDLTIENESTYFCCLEDWSEEIAEAGDHKAQWYKRARDQGLRVKLARAENRDIVGMIQYMPIEKTHVEGNGLYFVLCIWVHGYKEGIGNHQGHGVGTSLLLAAEADVRDLGAAGIAAWGVSVPAFMRASWFRKHGYRNVDKDGVAILLWKPFAEEAEPPRWRRQQKSPESIPGQVTVSAFKYGWCPAQNLIFERAKRAVEEVGGQSAKPVVFEEYETTDPEVLETWGIADALYIDGAQVRTGPPPSYAKIRKKILKRTRRK